MGPSERDLEHLRRAVALASEARARGDGPFGALLVDGGGRMLAEATNTTASQRDCTAHAELNLLRAASRRYAPADLADCTLYASAEPCPMCAGAVFWSGVGRLVYALSTARLAEVGGGEVTVLPIGCRDVLAFAGRPIEVVGPLLEAEAARPFTD